jgi:hypothetical protein
MAIAFSQRNGPSSAFPNSPINSSLSTRSIALAGMPMMNTPSLSKYLKNVDYSLRIPSWTIAICARDMKLHIRPYRTMDICDDDWRSKVIAVFHGFALLYVCFYLVF